MTQRGQELHATADAQVAELIGLMLGLDETTLRLPCPGREKLGDGTVAASIRHAADNYHRIAAFVRTSDRMSGAHPTRHGAHRIPRLLRAVGHGPADHTELGPATGQHENPYTADIVDLGAVVRQLSAGRDALGRIAERPHRRTASGSATGNAPSSRFSPAS